MAEEKISEMPVYEGELNGVYTPVLVAGENKRFDLGGVYSIVNSAVGGLATVNDVGTLKTALTVHPSYTPPTAQLSSTQSQSGLEIGQTINIPLTVAFTQNDGGTASGTSLKKDGTQISTANSFTDSGVVMSATPKVYQATVSYGQGAIKNNNFSEADANGRIGAGSVNSNSLSYRGYYFSFSGPVASNPTNSAAARALNSQIGTNKTVILNTGTTQSKFAAILPPGSAIVSVIDLDALGADITGNYALVNNSFSISDAGGSAYTSPLFVMTAGTPYTTNHRHQIIYI